MAKLIDILARELKVWPEKSVAAVQQNSFDGRVSFVDCMDVEFSIGQWDYIEPCSRIHYQKEIHSFERADDWRIAIVTHAEWQAAVDALNAPKVVEWDGVGRPPVGVNVNIRHKGASQGTGIVLFYGEETCLIKNTTKYLEREQFGVINDYVFTPIRTAEQVAAEEREKSILELVSILNPREHALYNVCSSIYDAGYRKQ